MAGHVGVEPVQFSAVSQIPAEERQATVDDTTASAGQAAAVPVHSSSTSQTLTTARQSRFAFSNSSTGHCVPLLGEQSSSVSQGPAATRQTKWFG